MDWAASGVKGSGRTHPDGHAHSRGGQPCLLRATTDYLERTAAW
jgi:hypothetical protein